MRKLHSEKLKSDTPPRPVVPRPIPQILIEDADAALPDAIVAASVSAAGGGDAAPDQPGASSGFGPAYGGGGFGRRGGRRSSSLTLAGLLDALCEMGSAEGRLLILTSNHIDKLPAELLRPGIVDAAVEFSFGNRDMVRRWKLSRMRMQRCMVQMSDGWCREWGSGRSAVIADRWRRTVLSKVLRLSTSSSCV